jgi:hypothetical protein
MRKNNIQILKILCILLIQKSSLFGQDVVGRYQFDYKEAYSTFTIQLNKNGTYRYQQDRTGNHLISEGSWVSKGKVIYLNDTLMKGFPISIIESEDKSDDSVRFNYVRYLDSTIETNVFLIPNKQTANACLISTADCKFEKGKLRFFKLRFGDSLVSRNYTVKSTRSNRFEIMIPLQYPLSSYTLLNGCKLIKKNAIEFQFVDPTMSAKPILTFKRIEQL